MNLAQQEFCSVCDSPFTTLSGGVQGCPVHGIRESVVRDGNAAHAMVVEGHIIVIRGDIALLAGPL